MRVAWALLTWPYQALMLWRARILWERDAERRFLRAVSSDGRGDKR